MKIKYKSSGKNEKWQIGTIIKEYKHFILIRHSLGYQECINKAAITTGDTKMEVMP